MHKSYFYMLESVQYGDISTKRFNDREDFGQITKTEICYFASEDEMDDEDYDGLRVKNGHMGDDYSWQYQGVIRFMQLLKHKKVNVDRVFVDLWMGDSFYNSSGLRKVAVFQYDYEGMPYIEDEFIFFTTKDYFLNLNTHEEIHVGNDDDESFLPLANKVRRFVESYVKSKK